MMPDRRNLLETGDLLLEDKLPRRTPVEPGGLGQALEPERTVRIAGRGQRRQNQQRCDQSHHASQL
jgi:hypothetical protein